VKDAPRKAVLLDRDGTVTFDKSYCGDPDQIELIPGAAEALRDLSAAGYLLVLVSNQSGVALGYFDEVAMVACDVRLGTLLQEQGIALAASYYCVHSDEDACGCRKPAPGMARWAANDLGLDLSSCFVIGDKTSDIGFAKNAGCRSVLVKTGYAGTDGRCDVEPDFVAEDIAEAARFILDGAPAGKQE
jgi:histidinol-phosphate phosphatase family protein